MNLSWNEMNLKLAQTNLNLQKLLLQHIWVNNNRRKNSVDFTQTSEWVAVTAEPVSVTETNVDDSKQFEQLTKFV